MDIGPVEVECLVDEWVDLTFEGQPLRVRACDLMPLVQQQVSD